jgi:tryptophan-rich sensory protein
MVSRTKKSQAFGLIGWLVVVFVAAAVGAVASVNAAGFYIQLIRPNWAPPSSIFGPVWTVLYASMGLAAWLVWRNGSSRPTHIALGLFLAQLALNALWSWLFFGFHQGALAFADVLLLWVLIAATMIAFWRLKPFAGVLMLPYLLWVSFAAALNYSVWHLNPQLLG